MVMLLWLVGCVTGPIDGPGLADIEVTVLPAPGSYTYLLGQAFHVDPREVDVAVVMQDVQTGEWQVPRRERWPIRADGSWSVDVAGDDGFPEDVVVLATLVPAGDEPIEVLDGVLPQVFEGQVQDGLRRVDDVVSPVFQFAQRVWEPRQTEEMGFPGPNRWSADAVWVDADGALQLDMLDGGDGEPECAEAKTVESLGYGTYRFVLETPPVLQSEHLTLGLFVRDSVTLSPVNELDIELSRWAAPDGTNAQFAVQPWQTQGNLNQFTIPSFDGPTTHAMTWTPDGTSFVIATGDSWPLDDAEIVYQWTYTGEDRLMPGNDRVHINLWLFRFADPTRLAWENANAMVSDFEFIGF